MREPDPTRAEWRTSSLSSDKAECVEVAPLVDGIAVRDSKDPEGPTLMLSSAVWACFVRAIERPELG